MSEIENSNGRFGLHLHSKCNHLMTLGFKGLNVKGADHVGNASAR